MSYPPNEATVTGMKPLTRETQNGDSLRQSIGSQVPFTDVENQAVTATYSGEYLLNEYEVFVTCKNKTQYSCLGKRGDIDLRLVFPLSTIQRNAATSISL